MTSATAPLKVLILLGSTRPKNTLGPGLPGRLSTRVGRFIAQGLKNCECRVIEPDHPDYVLDILVMPYHWAKATKAPISPNLQRLVDATVWCDAVVVCTPEYNFAPSPAILNMLDHIPPGNYGGGLRLKPALTVSYSMNKSAGVRALTVLRSVVGEMGCVLASAYLAIAEAHLVLTPEGEEIPQGPKKEMPVTVLLDKAISELVALGHELKRARAEQKRAKI